MSEPITVVKYSHQFSLAEAPCGACGHAVRYNLSVPYVDHADPAAVGVCAEPWPDEPRPEWVKAAIRQAEADAEMVRRAGPVMDRAFERLAADVHYPDCPQGCCS